jgi:hypothetical protein
VLGSPASLHQQQVYLLALDTRSSPVRTDSTRPIPNAYYQTDTVEPQGLKSTRADGTNIILIDTPGFNDTKRPDTELLTSIISFIQQRKYQIISVIYIHAITERKLSGSTFKSLRVLRALCGEHYFQNIFLVTSMWTKAPAEEMEDQLDREVQFNSSPQFWGDILEKGARYFRWDDTKSVSTARNAREIMQICEKWDDAPKLALFLEMENGIKLEDTEAYRVLTEQARKRKEQEQRAQREEEEEMAQLRAQKARLEAIAGIEKDDCRKELRELRQLEGEQGISRTSAVGQVGCGLRDMISALPRPAVLRRRSESAVSSESTSQHRYHGFRGHRTQSPSRDGRIREQNDERSGRSSGERRYESGPEGRDGRRSGRRSQHSDYEVILVRRKRK